MCTLSACAIAEAWLIEVLIVPRSILPIWLNSKPVR